MTPCRARSRRPRRGVTMAELLITMVLIAVLAKMAGPRVAGLRGAQAVRGARGEVVATIEAARAAALQRGRPAWVVRRDDTLVAATLDENAAAARVVVATADLYKLYGATVRTTLAADDSISFDGRGLANPRLGRTVRYVVSARSTEQRDSVCVTSIGLLLATGCTP